MLHIPVNIFSVITGCFPTLDICRISNVKLVSHQLYDCLGAEVHGGCNHRHACRQLTIKGPRKNESEK